MIALLLCGSAGVLISLDFTPSAFLGALSAAAALVVFVAANAQWRDDDAVPNPVTAGLVAACAAFFIMLLPSGKAMTWLAGTSVERVGVVEGHHRSRRGICRNKIDIRLDDGDSVKVCGSALPPGLPVRVSVMSSMFGRYATQSSREVNLAGNGSLDSIVRGANMARERGDRALEQAASVDVGTQSAPASQTGLASERPDHAASDQAFKDLQAWADQARAEAQSASEGASRTAEEMRRAAEEH